MKPEPPREAADLARLPQLPAERELSGRRHRQLKEFVMQEIAESAREDATPGSAHRPRRPRPSRRRLAYFAVPIAAAGAFAIVAVSGGIGSTPGAGTTASDSQATRLLGRIADVAQSKPLQTVRDDQFVYVASKSAFEQDTVDSNGGYHAKLAPLHLRQIWLSVNGSRPGLLREGGQDLPLGTQPAPSINAPDYRYLESLPTDPAKLLAKIYAETKGEGKSAGPDAEAFTTIGDLLREQVAPPAVTAALYRAAAMIPGVRVINDVVDVTGHHDVAVALDNSAAINEWLFNKSNLEFAGEQSISVKAGPLGPAGTIVGTQITLEHAIVDRAGEVPAASGS